MSMKQMIVDTSSIVFVAGSGTDIFAAIEERMPGTEVIVSNGIVEELERIAGSPSSSKKAAKLALKFITRHKIKMMKGSGEVDVWIAREGESRKCAVCTNDIGLKEELKRRKVEVLSAGSNGILR